MNKIFYLKKTKCKLSSIKILNSFYVKVTADAETAGTCLRDRKLCAMEKLKTLYCDWNCPPPRSSVAGSPTVWLKTRHELCRWPSSIICMRVHGPVLHAGMQRGVLLQEGDQGVPGLVRDVTRLHGGILIAANVNLRLSDVEISGVWRCSARLHSFLVWAGHRWRNHRQHLRLLRGGCEGVGHFGHHSHADTPHYTGSSMRELEEQKGNKTHTRSNMGRATIWNKGRHFGPNLVGI